MNEEQLKKQLSRLKQDISPPEDLWQNIKPKLNQLPAEVDQSKRWPLQGVIAAGFCLVIITGFWLRFSEQPVTETVSRDVAAQNHVMFIDREYASAVRELGLQADQQNVESDSLDQQFYNKQLALLQKATDDIRMALELEPDAVYLAQILESTYQKRLTLLKQINSMRTST